MVECVNCAKFKGCDLSSPNVNECADYTEKLTNEEYIRQASTEELAKEIADHIFVSCTTNKAYSNPLYAMVLHDVVEWLKEKHNGKNDM